MVCQIRVTQILLGQRLIQRQPYRSQSILAAHMNSDLPFSPSCERNKQPILDKLQIILSSFFPNTNKQIKILEIGSGTAQHAVHFANALPNIEWQTSDQLSYHEGIKKQLDYHSNLVNIKPPFLFDVDFDEHWQKVQIENGYDIVYTANTTHIMSWEQARKMINQVPSILNQKGGLFVVYGPFKKGDQTTPGNLAFDQSLQLQSDGVMGVRELEDVKKQAVNVDMVLREDYAMPANNDLLVFQLQ
eukprot:TRINITY_DN2717_c0_g2_i9.p3 TRINITY_DN2717_c0_g2~~TRINITY_DN2717_c0_g2_i9.p3  ORF type:complete len:245 (-),score=21.82 TRINITY_DN2717_c0_g2_i9:1087-1821(-)